MGVTTARRRQKARKDRLKAKAHKEIAEAAGEYQADGAATAEATVQGQEMAAASKLGRKAKVKN
jgi:hypothetical protein